MTCVDVSFGAGLLCKPAVQAENTELRDGIRYIISTPWPYDVSQLQVPAEAYRVAQRQASPQVSLILQARMAAMSNLGCLRKRCAALVRQVTAGFIAAPASPEQGMHQNPLRIVSRAEEVPKPPLSMSAPLQRQETDDSPVEARVKRRPNYTLLWPLALGARCILK